MSLENNLEKNLIPDLIEPLIGYRIFKVNSKQELISYYIKDHIWTKGVNKAVCYPKYINYTQQELYSPLKYSTGDCHLKNNCPNHDCCCGLYACFSLNKDYKSYNLIDRIHYTSYDYYTHKKEYKKNQYYTIGKIAGWGRCEVYETGFRSQYAKVLALAYNSAFNDLKELQYKTAYNYNIDLLNIDKI